MNDLLFQRNHGRTVLYPLTAAGLAFAVNGLPAFRFYLAGGTPLVEHDAKQLASAAITNGLKVQLG